LKIVIIRRESLKGGDGEERWITVHPYGPDSKGQPVLLHVNPNNPGVGRVIGGAGGKLNYKVFHIKTKEEYARAAKERRESKKANRGSGVTGDSKAKKAVSDHRQASREHTLGKLAETMRSAGMSGWDESDLSPKPESLSGMGEKEESAARRKHTNMMLRRAKSAIKSARKYLVENRSELKKVNSGSSDVPLSVMLMRDAERVSREYSEKTKAVPDSVMREEISRELSSRIDSAKASGDSEGVVDVSGRLAASRNISPEDIDSASAEELAGYCRTGLRNKRVSDEKRAIFEALGRGGEVEESSYGEDDEVDTHLSHVESEVGASLEDAILFSRAPENADALRDAARHLQEMGMFDPDKVKADRDSLAVARFEALGAPKPDEVSADVLDELDAPQLRVLAEYAAPRLRRMTHAEEAQRESAGIVMESKLESLSDEAVSRHLMDEGTLREFLSDAISVGAIGKGAESIRKERELEDSPKPSINVNEASPADRASLSAALLGHDDSFRRIDRAYKDAATKIDRGLEVDGLDYDTSTSPKHAVRGGAILPMSQISEEQIGIIENEIRTGRARSYLDSYYKINESAPDGGGIKDSERGMSFHLSSGAASALNEQAVTFFGRPVMDRQTIDTIGVDAATKILAWHIHNQDKGKTETRADSVGRYHAEHQERLAEKAESSAKSLYDDAVGIYEQLKGEHDVDSALELSSRRLQKLRQARQIMGETLGQLEATASLHGALSSDMEVKSVQASLGSTSVESAVKQLASIGLEPEDYQLDHDGVNTFLTVKEGGFHKLVTPLPESAKDLQRQRVLMSEIRSTDKHDEDGWLPPFFSRRARLPDVVNQAPRKKFVDGDRLNVDMSAGNTEAEAVEKAVIAFVGQRSLDGWMPDEIQDALNTQGVVPSEHQESFRRAFNRVLPPFDQSGRRVRASRMRANMAAATNAYIENAGLKSDDVSSTTHGQVLDRELVHDAAFRSLATIPEATCAFKPADSLNRQERDAVKQFFRRKFRFTEKEQRDNESARNRVQSWIQQNPEPERWVLPGEGDSGQVGLFGAAVDGAKPEDIERLSSRKSQLRSMGRAELEGELSARQIGFDGTLSRSELADLVLRNEFSLEESSEWSDWSGRMSKIREENHVEDRPNVSWSEFRRSHRDSARDEATEEFRRREGRDPSPLEINEIARTVGSGETQAIESVQDGIKGRFFGEFASNYEGASHAAGKPQAVARSKEYVRGHIANRVFTDEGKEAIRSQRKESAERSKERDTEGRNRYQARDSDVERQLNAAEATGQQQGRLNVGLGNRKSYSPADVRTHLGSNAEDMIAESVSNISSQVRPDSAFSVVSGASMSGARLYQQKAIKSAASAKRMGLFADMGSGKTVMSVGAFCEAHSRPGGPRRGLFVVPGKVRGQFDSTALAFLSPQKNEDGKKLTWFCNPSATQEERLEAYKDSSGKNMVFVSHEDIKSDVSEIVHRYLVDHGWADSREDSISRVSGKHPDSWLSEDDGDPGSHTLPNIVKLALEHHGASALLDSMCVDEGHRSLNRQGKKDSHFARVVDALSSKSDRFLWMTGTSVKNDLTEAFDAAKKIRPDLYGTPSEAHPHRIPMDEFMRRHSGDRGLWGPALRQEMDPFTFTVSSDEVQKTMGDVPPAKQLERWHLVSPTGEQKARLKEIDRATERLRQASKDGRVDVDSAKSLLPARFSGKSQNEAEVEAKRISDSPGSLAFARNAAIDHAINRHPNSAKIAEVVRYAREAIGHDGGKKPGIVFARNISTAKRIKRELEGAGVLVGFMGAGDPRGVERAKSEFVNGNTDVVVLTDACSEGIDGLQHRAKWLVQHDTPDTHVRHAQRMRRLYRPGVTGKPDMVTLSLDVPQEHRARERVKTKAALLEAVQGPADENGFADYMSESGAM